MNPTAWHLVTSFGHRYHFESSDFNEVVREAKRILEDVPSEIWVRILDTRGTLWFAARREGIGA